MIDRVRQDEAREVQKGHFDPYQLDPSHVLEPPTSFGEIMRKTGPGMVLAAVSLARAEAHAVLGAVVNQVTTLKCGQPGRRPRNTTRGLTSLPLMFS